ncbi:MAG: PepSY domain-containing protein [Candidatus Oleimicrobiaceae bacterium]
MKVNKRIAGALVAVGLLVAAMGAQVVFAQTHTPPTPPAAVQQEAGPDDQVQAPSYAGSIVVDQARFEGMSEADEAAALQGMAIISADQAKAAAEAANPGATAVKVELDNENGTLVYSVELSNGLDVKVDAGNGAVLHTEQADADEAGAADTDNVQEEFGSQADDATETPGVEDAVGQ